MDIEIIKEITKNIPYVNSIYFWIIILFFILFISELKINNNNIKEKFAISYIIMLFLKFYNLISIKFILLFSIIFYFIFIEIVFTNEKERQLIRNGIYYFLDYLYKMIFQYKYHLYLISLFIISNPVYMFINKYYHKIGISFNLHYILVLLAIAVYIYTISRMFTNKFNTYSLSEVEDRIKKS